MRTEKRFFKVSTSERGVYLIEMKLAPSLPIKRFALDQAKVTYKKGNFFYLGFLLAPDTMTSSRPYVPFTISCAKRSDREECANRVLRECHKIWFTGFETVRSLFDDKTDNVPTSWVPDCCFILKK